MLVFRKMGVSLQSKISMVMSTVLIGILLPLAGTMLGSAFVFFMKKEISDRLQKTLLGFASGVMEAASVWSLLIPSIEMAGESIVPAAVERGETPVYKIKSLVKPRRGVRKQNNRKEQ